ncbi:hypothetical protein EVG20_g5905 [Dentipellis fragilis]|uniref:CNH domain-containing protein n=1 Tax=Dentipellis fragilis TaxID=205917 RepID=A0A4Y9YS20_9AGAM|nr:hypothetical protein EVG20_g5905 [Dentipellis fragilis]
MTSAPTNPLDVPPYQVQPLIAKVLENDDLDGLDGLPGRSPEVRCAQALGSEIYVGSTDGQLLRFALQANGPGEPESYTLISRQQLPSRKPVEEIVIVQSISIVFVVCDRQVYFFRLPSLDPLPYKPIRNVAAFAVDHQHILRPAPPIPDAHVEPIEFCIVKRTNIALYSFLDRPVFIREIPLQGGAFLARRSGRRLVIADREMYSVLNLEEFSLTPVLPISQAPPDSGGPPARPIITVIAENEFLILSWNGASTMGLFITGDADPVRGTLEWPAHPMAVLIPAPPLPSPSEMEADPSSVLAQERRKLAVSAGGFLVPSREQSEKLRLTKVKLLGRSAKPGGRTEVELPTADMEIGEREPAQAQAQDGEPESEVEEDIQEVDIPPPSDADSVAPYDV